MKKYLMRLDDIEKARKVFCDAKCKICPISSFNNSTGMECDNFTAVYPDKAAELMGLEVVEAEDKLHLTEQELAICKALGAKWVSWDKFHIPELRRGIVDLWKCSPHYNGAQYSGTGLLARVDIEMFPSLNPGDLVNVEEILKEAAP